MLVINPQSKQQYVGGNTVTCFLGGGITNCRDWQKEVIEELYNLEKQFDLTDLVILNPRRQYFDVNKIKAEDQIKWQFNFINISDLFSMFFCGDTDSPQPICFFEYGKQLVKRKNKVNTLIVTAEKTFKRIDDVIIQTKLMFPNVNLVNFESQNYVKTHAYNIVNAYKSFQNSKLVDMWSYK